MKIIGLATMSGEQKFIKIEMEGETTMDKVGKVLGGKYIEEGINQLIRSMLESGKTPKEIADFCGIPLDYVLKVQ